MLTKVAYMWSKSSETEWNIIKINNFSFLINFKIVIYSFDGKAEYSEVSCPQVFSFTWSFRLDFFHTELFDVQNVQKNRLYLFIYL